MANPTALHLLAKAENRGVTYRKCDGPLDALIHLRHRTASHRVIIDCANAIGPEQIGAAGFRTRAEDEEVIYLRPESPTDLAHYLAGLEDKGKKADSPNPLVVLIYEPRLLLGDDWRQKFKFGSSGILSVVFAYENDETSAPP